MKFQQAAVSGDTGASPPSRGAWIEMCWPAAPWRLRRRSPPSRGAWIEICSICRMISVLQVAPLAGGVD